MTSSFVGPCSRVIRAVAWLSLPCIADGRQPLNRPPTVEYRLARVLLLQDVGRHVRVKVRAQRAESCGRTREPLMEHDIGQLAEAAISRTRASCMVPTARMRKSLKTPVTTSTRNASLGRCRSTILADTVQHAYRGLAAAVYLIDSQRRRDRGQVERPHARRAPSADRPRAWLPRRVPNRTRMHWFIGHYLSGGQGAPRTLEAALSP